LASSSTMRFAGDNSKPSAEYFPPNYFITFNLIFCFNSISCKHATQSPSKSPVNKRLKCLPNSYPFFAFWMISEFWRLTKESGGLFEFNKT
jgi:hypothetical protein